MEKITKLIQIYSDDIHNQSTNSVFTIESYTPSSIPQITKQKKYHQQLVIAKILISELQERCISQENELQKQKVINASLDSQLNEALNTIKTIHSEYKLLTNKFNEVNHTISIEDNHTNQVLNLQKEIRDNEQMYQININKLTHDLTVSQSEITTLTNQVTLLKNLNDKNDIPLLKSNKEQLTNENFSLRKQILELTSINNQQFKESKCEIERLKSQISLMESNNHLLTVEVKEKEIDLQKQKKINEQYNTLEQQYTISMTEKEKNYTNLYNQFNILMNENSKARKDYEDRILQLISEKNQLLIHNNEDKDKDKEQLKMNGNVKVIAPTINNYTQTTYNEEDNYIMLKKLKEYIEGLLIKIHPNGSLIKQIIDLYSEVLQLENQKFQYEKKMNNKDTNQINILSKLQLQIQLFKNELKKHEIELSTAFNYN